MFQTDIKDRQRILRQAFWSGEMRYKRWRGIMRKDPNGHRRAVLQSFLYLPVRWLLDEIKEEKFIKVWPKIRKMFNGDSAEEKTAVNAWDAVWGMIAACDSQYPIDPNIAMISRKRREILQLVVGHPGISAYLVAKKTGRDYSRIYKDVQILIEKGMVEAIPQEGSIRRAIQLIPKKSCNAVLTGFVSIPTSKT